MLMNEIKEKTGLSRKAIEYYEAKGLISPKRNGSNYRVYSDEDLEALKNISVYRKLGCSVEEIENIIRNTESLSAIIRKREIKSELDKRKTQVLKSLQKGKNIDSLKYELELIDRQETIFTKLSEIFPGYIGQAFFMAYKPFLNEPLNPENQKYFFDYIEFLDNLPDPPISNEETELIERAAKDISVSLLEDINAEKATAAANYNKWFEHNKETVEQYMAFKQTEAYKNNPVIRIQEKIKEYLAQNGYYDIAIPLMRRFSPSYDEYYKNMLEASDEFINKKL